MSERKDSKATSQENTDDDSSDVEKRYTLTNARKKIVRARPKKKKVKFTLCGPGTSSCEDAIASKDTKHSTHCTIGQNIASKINFESRSEDPVDERKACKQKQSEPACSYVRQDKLPTLEIIDEKSIYDSKHEMQLEMLSTSGTQEDQNLTDIISAFFLDHESMHDNRMVELENQFFGRFHIEDRRSKTDDNLIVNLPSLEVKADCSSNCKYMEDLKEFEKESEMSPTSLANTPGFDVPSPQMDSEVAQLMEHVTQDANGNDEGEPGEYYPVLVFYPVTYAAQVSQDGDAGPQLPADTIEVVTDYFPMYIWVRSDDHPLNYLNQMNEEATQMDNAPGPSNQE